MSPSSQQRPLPPSGSVGTMIRRRRLELGLSQADLADLLGTYTTVSDIEALESSRIVMPSWIRLMHLAAALDLPVEAFLGAAEAANPTEHITPAARAEDQRHENAFDPTSSPEACDGSAGE